MRFASLSLERYGHFDRCELVFRSGAPDLHVIYGANEAGKTTSLAAVSDLLFGFPTRSPYNFVFDYSLLRVGAVLQEDDRTLVCRRKKGASGTLIDAQDNPLDEGILLAMLRGQTRETFDLSFSLDQDGLRAGGRAMVNARDDAGRALFAAGSGMIGVSDELARLEEEADAIWGPRAAQRRSFTQAQRDLIDHTRAARDQALKPRTWLDAKAALASAEATLDVAQRLRDQLLVEVRRDERIRRIAPFARLRTEHMAAISSLLATVDIAPQREEAAEVAMTEAESATRAKAAAEQLAREATERMDAVTADPAILAQAERIDELVTSQGAIDKALQDMARLATEKEVATALVARLRNEAGSLAADPPTRLVSSKLREIGLAHAQDAAALSQIEESEETLALRRDEISGRTSSKERRPELKSLAPSVDVARALGADVDTRCETTQRKADVASSSLKQALARLAPWTGDADALLALPRIAQDEIETVRSNLEGLAGDTARAEEAAARCRDEVAALTLQMEQLASGSAVSPDEIAAARSERSLRWIPLREHVLSIAPLASPDDAVAAFETTVAQADERSDLRFAAADESSRLSILEQRRASLMLEAEQAKARETWARERSAAIRSAWGERLSSVGYPDMPPSRINGWLADRDAAEAANESAAQAVLEADATRERRDKARATLAASLTSEAEAPSGADLAPLLAFAERVRKESEDAVQQEKLDLAALAQLDLDADGLGRRRNRIMASLDVRAAEWRELVDASGIALDIADATAMLDILDELRAAIADHAELQSRINGISRDARKHEESVDQTAEAVGISGGKNGAERLQMLRKRLMSARSAAVVLATLQENAATRTEEAMAAEARLVAAGASLRALMDETGSTDMADLSAAIERSRAARGHREAVAIAETEILSNGDGYGLEELIASLDDVDIDSVAARAQTLSAELARLNAQVAEAATAHGDARRAFASLEVEGGSAVDAASAAEEARAELAVLAEQYILKRAQVVSLKWAIEQYRERHQDPMLLRASTLFSTLTLGRYAALRVDSDGPALRLLGLRDDGRTVVEVGAMSEGTTDQLFLALRLAAVEQSIAAGVRLPFLADDLFVNFDDERSEAGFRVLAELARSTQVLFFTHHPHLAAIARSVVGADQHSECTLA